MNILRSAKLIPIRHNVSIRILDAASGELISECTGHNSATNSLVTGIAHYLTGDGVLNQGYHMLEEYVPKYISLGTMGLINQNQDNDGLPSSIGESWYSSFTYDELPDDNMKTLGYWNSDKNIREYPDGISGDMKLTDNDDECLRFVDYVSHCPGYGADGYDENLNNGRKYLGLGPVYGSIVTNENDNPVLVTNNCELISDTFPRAKISFRDIVPETEAEISKTVDVVFSAMVSTGALKQFREYVTDADGNSIQKPYIFITEAGLWARPDWVDGGDNGLLAGYRIGPTDHKSDMRIEENRNLLKQRIIKVGINQVVQVIWKIQLGSIEQYARDSLDTKLRWVNWFNE